MGMFDYVDYEADCEECGAPLGDLQTKDTSCMLSTVTPDRCSYFYGICDSCSAGNEFRVKVRDFEILRRTESSNDSINRWKQASEALNNIKNMEVV